MLQTEGIRTVEQIRAFLNRSEEMDFAPRDRDGAYGFVRRTLVLLRYEAPDADRFLKPGVTFAELDKVAYAMSDLDANRQANRARDELFRAIGRALRPAA